MLEPLGLIAAFLAMLALGTAVWAVSVPLKNASIVDSFWSIFFVAGFAAYVVYLGEMSARALLVGTLLVVWAARLSGYITWRNHGHGEDRRYQAIRARNEPNYAFKSLFIVFWLQGAIAFVVALPLFAAASAPAPLGLIDYLGAALWLAGFLFETVGDAQMARFKANPANAGRVMDRGLWRYTRHPNYFGEALLWWGFGLIAAGAGAVWALVSPLIMTLLLLKVSGVALLEKDLTARKPQYADYIRRTSAFLPLPPRRSDSA